jgi:NitT/TauT family transport system permease protein
VSIRRWLERHSRLQVLGSWLAVLLLWEAAYRLVGWAPWIFPAPSHVIDATLNLLSIRTYFSEPLHAAWPWSGASDQSHAGPPSFFAILQSQLVIGILTSGYRLAIGFVLSMLMGLLLGVLMWRYQAVNSMLGPVFLGMQTLPSVCWVPLAILTLGISELGILFVLIMGSFFAMAISLRDGLATTPPIYRAAGLVFGARGLNFYWYVMLPAGLPALASSLRSGFSFAWRSLMGGELIFVLRRHGLGQLLSTGREFGDIAQVVATMGIMVMIGMVVDRLLFAKIEKGVRARFGLA